MLWNHLKLFLTNDIPLPILTPQRAIFGFINRIENNMYKVTNHILLTGTLELGRLIKIKKVNLLEKKIDSNDVSKLERYNNN